MQDKILICTIFTTKCRNGDIVARFWNSSKNQCTKQNFTKVSKLNH